MTKPKFLNTSQKIFHVFACNGTPQHFHTGQAILRFGEMKCPTCGAEIRDVTEEQSGQDFFAFTRTDLGDITQ